MNAINTFLNAHYGATKDRPMTHTKIKDASMKKPGGIYHIPVSELDTFWTLYYKYTFVEKNECHLTEAQPETGIVAVDLDLRYPLEVTSRMHTPEMIQDLIDLYLREINKIAVNADNDPFPIFVMEKPQVNRVAEKNITKDGLHILFGIRMHHALQLLLRERILEHIGDILGELPLVPECTWESVLDDGISRGTTNWQLYGSCKPGNQAYRVVAEYIADPLGDGVLSTEEDIGTKENFFTLEESDTPFVCAGPADLARVSVQNMSYPEWTVDDAFKQRETEIREKYFAPKKKSAVGATTSILCSSNDIYNYIESAGRVHDEHTLIAEVDLMLAALRNKGGVGSRDGDNACDAHAYTQILPEKYYEPGSHDINTRIALALHHTDVRMFLSWIMLRSKASDFNFNEIPAQLERWNSFKVSSTGVTRYTIRYHAMQDAREAMRELTDISINHLVDESLTHDVGDYGYALLLEKLYGDKYICTNISQKIWYSFHSHRWHEDRGMSLRRRISEGLYVLYEKRRDEYVARMETMEMDTDDYKKAQTKCNNLIHICLKLRTTRHKNDIMREASEIFYDGDFESSADENSMLLCTPSGVVDFNTNCLRPGQPQDYITKCTKYPYIPRSEWTEEHHRYAGEVSEFMRQLYPLPRVCEWMWDYDASTLIGIKKQNIFAIHEGSGCNGKSKKMELMNCLGDYQTTLKVNVLTEKTSGVGSTSSEISKLKGVRFVFMKEPSKGATLNEGLMKEITGGEDIEARSLFKNSAVFFPQFSLSVCLNTMFEVSSNDDGTWRRMKVINYRSKFASPEEEFTPEPEFRFPIDKNLSARFKDWGPIYLSILIEICFQKAGEVVDCPEIIAASKLYRNSQDSITRFINEHIVKDENESIGKMHLSAVFKEWYTMEGLGKKAPKFNDLVDAINVRFGDRRKSRHSRSASRWVGLYLIPLNTVAINEEEDEDYEEFNSGGSKELVAAADDC